ncbi:hypothetical protein [Halalkalicoccus paucihalophilus]|nr:hypothetical protein [Halalkalicoccus paucihalophilus]
MVRFTEPTRYFLGRDVAVAFTLLLVFPALAYFALTVPVWLQDQFLTRTVAEPVIWGASTVVLYVESVGVAALYRVVRDRSRTGQRLSYDASTDR